MKRILLSSVSPLILGLPVAAGLLLTGAAPASAQFTVGAGSTSTTSRTLSGTQTGTVEATGTLQTTGTSVTLNNSATGALLDNAGTIRSTGSRSFDTSGAANARTFSLVNRAGALFQSDVSDAFRINTNITGGSVTITNSGTIRAAAPTDTASSVQGQALDLRTMNRAGVALTVTNTATGLIEALNDDALRPGLNAVIDNAGTIRSFGANTSGGANGTSDAIDAGARTGVAVTNQATGVISGARHGITADNDISVTNLAGGTITGRNGSGVGSDGNGMVVNRGTISGDYAGAGNIFNSSGTASANGDGDGVDIDLIATISNYGTIRGTGAGGVDSGGRPNGSEGIAAGGGTILNAAGATITGATRGILIDDGASGSAYGATTITNEGTIAGLAGAGITLVGTYDDTVTNSGTISGAGTGAVALDLGAGNDSLTVRGGGFSGAVRGGAGSDTLVFAVGDGATYGDANAFSGFETTRIDTGTVRLTGSLESTGRVTVAAGAGLGGSASIATATLANAGTVSPGSETGSIGTLAVTGGFTNASTGTLAVDIDAAGRSDLLQADGTAVLDGGTLALTAASGTYAQDTAYTVLSATGGVTGRFATLSGSLPSLFLMPEVSYGADAVRVTVVRNATTYESVASGAAGTAVARALDQAQGSATGNLKTALGRLNQLDAAQAASAFDQMAPDASNAFSTIATGASSRFRDAVGQRLGAVRSAGGANAPGQQFAFAGNPAELAAAPADAAAESSRGGVWGRGFGLYGRADGDAGMDNGFDWRGGGMQFGADAEVAPGTVVGVSAGFSRTIVLHERAGTDGDVSSYQLGLYGSQTWGRTDLNVQVGVAQNDYHGSRRIDFVPNPGLATSDFGGTELSAAVEGGRTYDVHGFDVRPAAGLSWTRFVQDSYTENGATGAELAVSGKAENALTATLGVAASAPFRTETLGTVTPSLEVRWGYDLVQPDATITSRFAGATGGSFTVEGNEPSRNAVILAAGVSAELPMGLALNLGGAAELRDGQQAYALLGRIRYQW
ncbi:autotransporter domain-containing protein [Skermanella mucosa]|uniref:autotransporter outer membrane beta-barrel domain-containing protein n=1 Tax=Skermanella mucosa TaxID=1789672 RepID=UPI00192A6F77|nr:autotransporter outer membrane beta-barrel domain-containing protein [Skermanella mucosa]UEM21982.1 autotransporter domain-containing protein [Skermanella mucosa]